MSSISSSINIAFIPSPVPWSIQANDGICACDLLWNAWHRAHYYLSENQPRL